MKRICALSLTLALLCTCVLAAVPTALADDTITLRICTYFGDSRFAPLEVLIDQFMKDNPNIKVEVERVAYSGHYAKKLAETASGTLPDIWEFVPGYGAYWLENDLLMDIAPYAKDDAALNLDDFDSAMLAYFQKGDGLYGLPYDINGGVLYFNKDLFDAAGLEYPSADWTFEDLKNAMEVGVEKLSTADKKVWGMSSPIQTDWVGIGYFDAWDAPIVLADGSIGTDNPNMLEMLKYWKGMLDDGLIPQPEPANPQNVFTQGMSLFTNGEAMMHVTYAGTIKTFIESGMNVGVAPMPAGPSGKHGTKLGGSWVASASTKYPEETYKLLSYICSEDSMRTYTQGLPARMSLNAGISEGLQMVAEAIKTYGWTVAINGCERIWTLKDKLLEQMWLDQITPEQVIEELTVQGNEIMESVND